MQYIVIGDLHIGKRLFTLIPNPYNQLSSKEIDFRYSINSIDYVITICELYHEIDDVEVIFLGDLYDIAYARDPWHPIITDLLNYICCINSNWKIHILVGNHDTRSYIGNINCTPLNLFPNKRVSVYSFPFSVVKNDHTLLFLPYRYRKDIERIFINAINELPIDKNHPILIFSHNDIFMENTFGDAMTLSKNRIQELLQTEDVYVFNGHLHKYHYEDRFSLLGSVSPTSFKETAQASGICVFDTNGELKTYKNVNTFFMSIDSDDYQYRLIEFLEQAKERNVAVFFRPPPEWSSDHSIYEKYKHTIIGIEHKTTE